MWQNRRKRARIEVRRNHLSILNHIDFVTVGENLRDVVRSLVHRVPQLPVARAWLEIHKCAARLKFIILLRVEIERDRVGEVRVILRLHLADPAEGDHHSFRRFQRRAARAARFRLYRAR
jgi:hypothetical protein